MYKQNLALNNQQWLICHQTKPNLFSFQFDSIQSHLSTLVSLGFNSIVCVYIYIYIYIMNKSDKTYRNISFVSFFFSQL